MLASRGIEQYPEPIDSEEMNRFHSGVICRANDTSCLCRAGKCVNIGGWVSSDDATVISKYSLLTAG